MGQRGPRDSPLVTFSVRERAKTVHGDFQGGAVAATARLRHGFDELVPFLQGLVRAWDRGATHPAARVGLGSTSTATVRRCGSATAASSSRISTPPRMTSAPSRSPACSSRRTRGSAPSSCRASSSCPRSCSTACAKPGSWRMQRSTKKPCSSTAAPTSTNRLAPSWT